MEKINLKAGEKFCVVHLDTDTGHVVAAPSLGVQEHEVLLAPSVLPRLLARS